MRSTNVTLLSDFDQQKKANKIYISRWRGHSLGYPKTTNEQFRCRRVQTEKPVGKNINILFLDLNKINGKCMFNSGKMCKAPVSNVRACPVKLSRCEHYGMFQKKRRKRRKIIKIN